MVTKVTKILYHGNTYKINYNKHVVDKNETLFSIIDVKSKSGINIWKRILDIHYYPLKTDNKISSPFYVSENLNQLKIEIALAIVKAEQLTL